MSEKLTTLDFITKAQKIHDNKYNYDQIQYVNCKTKIKIFCNKCKTYFWQEPRKHLEGRGCPTCGNLRKIRRSTQTEFIQKSLKIHKGKYSYDQVVYKDSKTPVKIWCNNCERYFYQTPNSHLASHGCPHCFAHSTKSIIKDFKKIHKNDYLYDNFQYEGWNKKSKIHCNKCNKDFLQTPSKHLQGHGCPHCKKSKGEKCIAQWLDNNKINYVAQKIFNNCTYKHSLLFDFYLPDYNLCIEFQGEQHYIPNMFISLFKSKKKGIQYFRLQQKRDKIKKDYCIQNNIQLIEINYKENIEEKLNQYLLKNNK